MNEIFCVVTPLGVVTTIFCAPAAPTGVVAVMDVGFTIRFVAALAPIFTLVAPVKFVPVMVIAVPPVVDPVVGLTLEIVGAKTT